MRTKALLAPLLLLVLGVFGALALRGERAQAEDLRFFDRSLVRTSSGTAYIDTSAADYTAWQTLITITPESGHALEDVRVVVDLDKATTGFADATGYDTETIQLSVALKVDGTNWRTITNLAAPSTAIAADNADDLAVELNLRTVGCTEGLKVMVKLSAEAASDVALPYVIYYRSAAAATVTPATN
jgi:hypothetical protein